MSKLLTALKRKYKTPEAALEALGLDVSPVKKRRNRRRTAIRAVPPEEIGLRCRAG